MGNRGTHDNHRPRSPESSELLDGHAPENPCSVFARQNLEASTQPFGPTSEVDESQASSKRLGHLDANAIVLDLEAHIVGHTYGDDVAGCVGVLAGVGQRLAEHREETVGDALGDRVVDGAIEYDLGASPEQRSHLLSELKHAVP